MIKKDDGAFSFKAAPEDFPQKHKGIVMDMAIADTGSLYTFVQHCLCSLQLPSQREKKLSVLSEWEGRMLSPLSVTSGLANRVQL